MTGGRGLRHAAALTRREGVRDKHVRHEETPARSDRATAEGAVHGDEGADTFLVFCEVVAHCGAEIYE